MKRNNLVLVFLAFLTMFGCRWNKVGQPIIYPSPLPGPVPMRFLPGIATTDSLDFNASFSPDGRIFYFSKSWRRKYQIWMTKFDGTSWGKAQLAPFSNPAFSNADAFVAADGSVFFMSNMAKDENDTSTDYDIWRVRQDGAGKWSKPEFLSEVNSDSTEYYVSIAQNGNLYFASDRPGGFGSFDIYRCEWQSGKYLPPQNLGSTINGPETEHDPLISKDESLLIFTASGKKDSFGEADLYLSKSTGLGNWSKAKNMGNNINTSTYEYCPNFSPDYKYFFFSSELDIKWVAADFLFK
jgi:WD40-like Beta Propeller Repeat